MRDETQRRAARPAGIGRTIWRDAGVAWVDAVLETWCGWNTPPVSQRICRADWTPDAPDAWCPRCGGSVGAGEVNASGCGSCRRRPTALSAVVRLGVYDDVLADWIRRLKYQSDWPIGMALGAAMGRSLLASGVMGDPPASSVRIVPMPMPWDRRLRRGIDHAWILGRGVRSSTGYGLCRPIRMGVRPEQAGRSATSRRRSGGAGLSARRRAGRLCDGRTVILVDDVRTTGGSLEGMARLLHGAGAARVVGCVAGVRDEPGRVSCV